MLPRGIRASATNYRSALLLRPTAARSFHVSSRCLAMSEQDHHKDEHERKSEIDEHKQDALDKQKKGTGHWKGELASSSEAAVKADREEIATSAESIKELQKETADIANKKHGQK